MLEIRIAGLRVEVYPAENPRYRSAIVLVHGLWSGAWCWRNFGSFLAHRGWEVVAVDLRGRSGSRPARIEQVTLADYAADLEALLSSETITARGAEEERLPPTLIGHDLGGLLALGQRGSDLCRTVIAIAPPLRSALSREYRRHLRRGTRWWRRRLPPPHESWAGTVEGSGLQPDSSRVGKGLLDGEVRIERSSSPTLIVGGERDQLVQARDLAVAARELGCEYLELPDAHWDLQTSGFERSVDPLHRWLVRKGGPELLRLTGYENLDEDEDPGSP